MSNIRRAEIFYRQIHFDNVVFSDLESLKTPPLPSFDRPTVCIRDFDKHNLIRSFDFRLEPQKIPLASKVVKNYIVN